LLLHLVTVTSVVYILSLHDALPICRERGITEGCRASSCPARVRRPRPEPPSFRSRSRGISARSVHHLHRPRTDLRCFRPPGPEPCTSTKRACSWGSPAKPCSLP